MATEKQERQKPHDVTKVVVRCIPAATSEQELLELFNEWTEHFDSFYLLKNVASMEQSEMCRFYVGFKDLQKALAFHGSFDGYVQHENRLVVELAPYPRLPKAGRSKIDAKQGCIDQDPEYLAYVETYESENPLKLKESALSAQSNQEQLLIEMEKRKEAKASNENEVTPLIQSIIDSRTRKDDFSVKIRQEERRKREREAELAAKKKRDEERRKMLDKKEAMLKEQRDKERRNKSQKSEEKIPEKVNKTQVPELQAEEQTPVEKNAEESLVENSGDSNKLSEKANGENKNESVKIAPVAATSRASRLKDLPSIKYYTPAAKAAKTASSTEPVPEGRSYSFLDRDVDENENSSRGNKRGFGRRGGGGSGPGREIKPSRGMHNGGPAYSSRGERKRENRKDSNPQSQESPINVETSGKDKKLNEKKDRESKNSTANESTSSTSEDTVATAATDSSKNSQEEPKKQTGPSIVKYPRDTASDHKSKNPGGPKSKGKQNRRQGADDWGMYEDTRQGHSYYDCPPAFYSSSWSRGGKGGGPHGGYSSRSSAYNQRQYEYGYGLNRNSYDYDRYADRDRAPASAGHSGKGASQKAPSDDKVIRASKFCSETKETKPTVFESAESRSLKKAEDGGKPPRFSDKRRATALSNNNENSVSAAL